MEAGAEKKPVSSPNTIPREDELPKGFGRPVRRRPTSLAEVGDSMRETQLAIIAAAGQLLPAFMQPFIVSFLNGLHTVDSMTDRFVTFMESLRFSPPQDFVEVLRRIEHARRPIEEVVTEVDGEYVVPRDPSPYRPQDPNIIIGDVREVKHKFKRGDSRSNKVNPTWRDIFG